METKLAALTLSERSPPPTSSLPRLPDDVIYLIIHKAFGSTRVPPLASSSCSVIKERYRFLLSAALTARAWRARSQTLLWSDVQLEDARQLQRFLVMGGLGRRTRVLRLLGDWPSSDGVVRGVVGLEELVLIGLTLERMERFLCLPSLQDLQSLHLEPAALRYDGGNNSGIALPFSLRYLHLSQLNFLLTHRPLFTALLAASSSLSIASTEPTTPPRSFFFPPTLTSLTFLDEVSVPNQSPVFWLTLEDALGSSTSIQHLSIPQLHPLRNPPTDIPYPLETLTILRHLNAKTLGLLIEGLRTETSLSALQVLRLEGRITVGPRKAVFQEMMALCEGGGIKVVFAQ